MRRLLRHTWSVGVLSALLVAGLLAIHPAGRSLNALYWSSDTGIPDTATPSPKQDGGTGLSIAIPLGATVPSAQSKPPLESVPEGTATSKGVFSDVYRAASASARASLANHLAGHTRPISRTHLFCVYRL